MKKGPVKPGKRSARSRPPASARSAFAIAALTCAFGVAIAAQSSGCTDGATPDCTPDAAICGPDAAFDSGIVPDAADAGDARTDASIDAADAADTAAPDASNDDASDASSDADAE